MKTEVEIKARIKLLFERMKSSNDTDSVVALYWRKCELDWVLGHFEFDEDVSLRHVNENVTMTYGENNV